MPYLGSAPRTTNAANLIDHKEYLGANADTATNSGYYTFVASYTPNHVSVIVRGINLATSDFVATNGVDIRIPTSSITLQAEDVIEIIGHTTTTNQVIERSDIHLTGGQAVNMQKVEARYFMNPNTYTADLHIPAANNAFFAGPVNFTGTLNVEGVLNVI